MKRGPLKVFYSYAHEDEAIRDRIDEHLKLLARQNLVVGWHDRRLLPGTEWNAVIGEMLTSADIVLLLVSRAFMASKYINQVEIPEAMRAHQSGKVRVVPILIERVPNWTKASFAKLQILPSRARPIMDWDDPVDAYHDIATGVAQVVKDIIIEGGGPFEFGAHEFTEAELASLPKAKRERAAGALRRLRNDLNQTIPARKYESNLLVATWGLREFGNRNKLPADEPEALFYMAQVMTSFDLVAVQDIHVNPWRLEALMEVLGPDWNVLMTDLVGGRGSAERFAILYYKPRVEFRNLASQVISNQEGIPKKPSSPVEQFTRPPLVAAFRAGSWDFQVCTAHLVFIDANSTGMAARLQEVAMLGDYLRRRSRYEETDLLLLGQFQMGTRDSPIFDALGEKKVQIPDELIHPTNIRKDRYYDLIGFTSEKRSIPLGKSRPRSGSYDLFQHVLRDEDVDLYTEEKSFRQFRVRNKGQHSGSDDRSILARQYWMWKTFLVSDHLPLWVELDIKGIEAK